MHVKYKTCYGSPCPAKGSNFRDPPRQGWRGGAPMDGLTACRRSCFLWLNLSPVRPKGTTSETFRARDGAAEPPWTGSRRVGEAASFGKPFPSRTKEATSETLRAREGAAEPPWMGSRRVGEVASFGRLHRGNVHLCH